MCTMILLGSTASPPLVPIRSVATFDDGSIIVVLGVIVDMSPRDDGAESLVLADLSDGAVLRVYCSPGARDMPGVYTSIGDELRIEGELSRLGKSPMLFARSDDVSLVEDAVAVLTISGLSRNWALFVGDQVEVSGIIISSTDGLRLADADLEHSIAIESRSEELDAMVGKAVSVAAFLRLQSETMVLVLDVVSALRSAGDKPFQEDR